MGQLPGNSGQMFRHRPFVYPRPPIGPPPFGIIVPRSQPESGSEEREMYEKYGKYPKFKLPDGRVQSLRSQSESGDEGDMDFYIAMDQFCKKSGNDLRWQGRHLCIKNKQGQIVISRTTYQYMFDTIDTNADGKISSDELMNYNYNSYNNYI